MIKTKQLNQFLVKAKKSTYAAGEKARKTIEKDKSTTLIFKDNDWSYYDNYFGGEPFGGREVVFFKNKPVYIMVYYGQIVKEVKDFKKIYSILQNALLKIVICSINYDLFNRCRSPHIFIRKLELNFIGL